MNGRSIRLFLPEGTPGQLFTAEIVNWTGRVTVFPRAELGKFRLRAEAQQPGVYLLMGQDPEHPELDLAYVGETEVLFDRLANHNRDDQKDFWQTTFVISSKDANLTKAHVRYLEARLVDVIAQANRVGLQNGNLVGSTQRTPLPEADQADMEYFLSQILLILPVVGFEGVRPRPTLSQRPSETADTLRGTDMVEPAQTFQLQMPSIGLVANAVESGGEFVVTAGSTARVEGQQSWKSYKPLRDQLVEEGKLVTSANPVLFEFKEDVTFRSPSAAAAVVLARNANGRIEWVHAGTGQEYGQFKDQTLMVKPLQDASATDDSV